MRPAPCGDGRSAHCARVVVRAQVAAMRRPGRSARARPRKGRCAKSGGCGAGAARASARRCGIRMESSARSRGRRASDGGGACHPSRALRLKRRCGSSPRSSARAVGRRCARRARTSTRSSGTPGDSACRPGARGAARDRCLADTAPLRNRSATYRLQALGGGAQRHTFSAFPAQGYPEIMSHTSRGESSLSG
jgi:hypothetical protein